MTVLYTAESDAPFFPPSLRLLLPLPPFLPSFSSRAIKPPAIRSFTPSGDKESNESRASLDPLVSSESGAYCLLVFVEAGNRSLLFETLLRSIKKKSSPSKKKNAIHFNKQTNADPRCPLRDDSCNLRQPSCRLPFLYFVKDTTWSDVSVASVLSKNRHLFLEKCRSDRILSVFLFFIIVFYS